MPSTKPWPRINSILLWLLAVIATIGLGDSLYLSITHYTNTLVPCSFSHGCETVLRSSYSEVLGIPVAALGVLFYLVVLIASVFFVTNKKYHWALSVWGLIGFGSTLYLFYIQAFVLHAFCQYCLVSTLTSTLTFIITAMLYYMNKHKLVSSAENN